MEILGRYTVVTRCEKKQITRLIFPRFHQLDATRKLRMAVLTEGPGEKYLIQHSAGSGKTNSITWSAHFLADLHDADDQKIFDTVHVVSARKVIDGRLQNAIYGLAPWSRFWNSLRASRETDLMDSHGLRRACAWIGNSPEIAIKHYSLMRKTDYIDAGSKSADKSADVQARNQENGEELDSEKPTKTLVSSGKGCPTRT